MKVAEIAEKANLWRNELPKIVIFGNSGSGKSTLAKELIETKNLEHLDLDILAWLPTVPPERAPRHITKIKIQEFMQLHDNWVIEGCYTDLLDIASLEADEIIFMNLNVSQCIENAMNRPWEPHKYESKEAQDNNLEMLMDWITQYKVRTDCFSYTSHIGFYEKFDGKKSMVTSNIKKSITGEAT